MHEPGGIDRVLEEFDREVGIERLRCLHLNDSKTAFGSNRDRHENIGDGEIGEAGMRSILGAPHLQGLPVILEVPGHRGQRARTSRTWRACGGSTRRASPPAEHGAVAAVGPSQIRAPARRCAGS